VKFHFFIHPYFILILIPFISSSSAKVAVMRKGKGRKMEMLKVAEIEEFVAEIEKEKEEEAAKVKKDRGGAAAAEKK
jgi:hypothetical protein